MEWMLKLAWLTLAAVHLPPAAVIAMPHLTDKLYGVSSSADAGTLIVHRGAMFLGIVVLASMAAFDEGTRRAASLVIALSVVGFLGVYGRAGWPEGPLRTIAIVDALAILPLALVSWHAWTTTGQTP